MPDPDDGSIREAAVAAAGQRRFVESGTRKVKGIPRNAQGQWQKKRSHTPVHVPTWAEGLAERVPVPVYDLARTPLSGLPPDVYERLDEIVGGIGRPKGWIDDTINVIRRVRGRPDAPVVVHTAAPPEARLIHPGDWVALAPGFARARAQAYPRWRTMTITVPASEVLTRSGDLLRWTWNGREPVPDRGTSAGAPVRGRTRMLPGTV